MNKEHAKTVEKLTNNDLNKRTCLNVNRNWKHTNKKILKKLLAKMRYV